MNCKEIILEVKRTGSKKRVETNARYFKTGIGEYGEGDMFLGLKMQEVRRIANIHKNLDLVCIETLLGSKYHEIRLLSLIILVSQFESGDKKDKVTVYNFYMSHLIHVNNWDLVDVSAHKIAGVYLQDKPRNVLYNLTKSDNLWKRRVAIISTFTFIRNNDFKDTLTIAELLLEDSHDLIHKACGWMLREVGRRDKTALIAFLDNHAENMPRTMLRYSIEHFSDSERRRYLNKQ